MIKFDCACAGCEGREVFNDEASADRVKRVTGHFFAPDTMRFFGCKVSSSNRLSGGGVVFRMIQKAGFGDDLGRVRRWAVACKYGVIVENYTPEELADEVATICPGFADEFPVDSASRTLLESAKAQRVFDLFESRCLCHGCQIDRAGVRRG